MMDNLFGVRADERCAIFLDGPNLYLATKSVGQEMDFKVLHQHMRDTCKLIRAKYYTAIIEQKDTTHVVVQPLLDFLDYNGFDVVTKTVKELTDRDGNRRIKAGSLKIEMAVDAMHIARSVDHVVLFTGDADYVPLILRLKDAGARVTIVSTRQGEMPIVADEMRRAADAFVDVSSVIAELGKKVQKPPVVVKR